MFYKSTCGTLKAYDAHPKNKSTWSRRCSAKRRHPSTCAASCGHQLSSLRFQARRGHIHEDAGRFGGVGRRWQSRRLRSRRATAACTPTTTSTSASGASVASVVYAILRPDDDAHFARPSWGPKGADYFRRGTLPVCRGVVVARPRLMVWSRRRGRRRRGGDPGC